MKAPWGFQENSDLHVLSDIRDADISYLLKGSYVVLISGSDLRFRLTVAKMVFQEFISTDLSSIPVSECALIYLCQGACEGVATCIHVSLGMHLCAHMCKYVFPCVCEGGCRPQAISGYLHEWMCWLRACTSLCICVSPRVGASTTGLVFVAVPLCHIYPSGGIFVLVCGHVLCNCTDEPAIF